MTESTRKVLVVVALPTEREAITDLLDDVDEGIQFAERTCTRGRLTDDELKWDVLVREAGRGNEAAGIDVDHLAGEFNPHVVLFLGIAGAIKDANRGDVVYATYVKGYEHGAEEPGEFRSREPVQMSSYRTEECAKAVKQRGGWHKVLRQKECESSPAAFGEPIAAGSKVLKAEDEEVIERIQEYLSDCIAVEMEGYGFAEGAYRRPNVDALVIRGISDNLADKGDDDEENAQRRAADHAAQFGIEVLREYQTRFPERGAPPSAISSYEDRFAAALGEMTQLPETLFEREIKVADDDHRSEEGLVDYWNDHERLLLSGAAGRGKTVLLSSIARNLRTEDNTTVVFLNLMSWDAEDSKSLQRLRESGASVEQALDVVLRASIADTTHDKLAQLAEERNQVYFLVDGLNEVGDEDVAKSILTVVNDFKREYPDVVHAIATTRSVENDFVASRWDDVELCALTADQVQSQLDSQFGEGTYDGLSNREREMLTTPFFLDLVLDFEDPHVDSKSDALRAFFQEEGLEFTEEELNRLSEAALQMYRENETLSIPTESLVDAVGDQIHRRLVDGGILQEPSEGEVSFMHQILQDYLAAHYLSENPEVWDDTTFKQVTMESASFDALSLTLEQIESEDQGDLFLKLVYDWTWPATVQCLRDNWPPGESFSRELADAMLFTIGEKLFDRKRDSRHQLKEMLETFPGERAERLVSAENMNQVLRQLRQVNGESNWFEQWRAVYETGPGETVTDDRIACLTDEDPVIGWTTANALRRARLTPADLRQVRTYLNHAEWRDTEGEVSNTVAWRCVHVLGVYPTENNRNLVCSVVTGADDKWLQYGAVRSLLEMCARTSEESFQTAVFEHLESHAEELPLLVQKEIASTLRYDAPLGDWADRGHSLLETLVEHAENGQQRELETEQEKFAEYVESTLRTGTE